MAAASGYRLPNSQLSNRFHFACLQKTVFYQGRR
jgi:hypothetical protein